MPPIKFLSANITTQYRSDRIGPRIWDRYKADIVREFQQDGRCGVAKVLKWIEKQEFVDFKPSRQQLMRQIKEVWKIDSENDQSFECGELQSAMHDDGSFSNSGAGTSCIPDQPREPELAFGDIVHAGPAASHQCAPGAQQRGSSRESEESEPFFRNVWRTLKGDKRKLTEAQDADQPVSKRIKGLGQFDVHAFQPAPGKSHSVQSDSSAVQSYHSNGVSSEDGNTEMFDSSEKVSNPDSFTSQDTSTFSQTLQYPRRLAFQDLRHEHEKQISVDSLIQNNNFWELGLESLEPMERTGLKWLLKHAEDLLKNAQTQIHGMLLLKDAADFLLYSTKQHLSFPLYVALWTLCETKRTIELLASCVCAANTPDALQFMRRVVAAELCRYKQGYCSHKLGLRFIFTAISIKIQDMESCCDVLWELADVAASREYPTLISIIEAGRSELDINTPSDMSIYYLCELILDWISENMSLLKETRLANKHAGHLTKLISKVPADLQLLVSPLDLPWIRKDLEWCQAVLEASYSLPFSLEVLRRQLLEKDRADSTCLFWYFWKSWNQEYDSLEDPFRATLSGDNSALTPAHFLAVLASLIVSETSTERSNLRTDSRLISKEVELIYRARTGVEVLLKLDDTQLSKRYLKRCTMLRKSDSLQVAAAGEQADRNTVVAYVSGLREHPVYRDLIETCVDTPEDSSGILTTGTENIHSSLLTPSLDPTLATSCSSSMLSEMGRLGNPGTLEKIRQRAARYIQLKPFSGIFGQRNLTISTMSDSLSLLSIEEEAASPQPSFN